MSDDISGSAIQSYRCALTRNSRLVTPRGHEFLFFSLFSVIGKTSSFIGPIVSSAIIGASPNNNNSTPFYFLFGLSLASFAFLAFFLDIEKSRIEQTEFLEKERREKEKVQEKVGSISIPVEVVNPLRKNSKQEEKEEGKEVNS